MPGTAVVVQRSLLRSCCHRRRKPGSHIAVGNPLNSLPLFLSFSALFVRPARSCSLRRAFIHVRLLPRSSLLLRLPPAPPFAVFYLPGGTQRVAHVPNRVLCQFDGNRLRVGNRFERILRRRMSRQTPMRSSLRSIFLFLYITLDTSFFSIFL